ncbi:Zinc finger, RING-type [Corchorus olitorius]|uniref:Zinc finger, RING-type n=1 Tax=Corchorus olitorius TaxID=93759 RepID=A0A1R3GVA4_9ROSI|nr:Zinc finger, RING-type [Corchorus olitorius]
MDIVKEIAGMKAEILDRLSNWGRYTELDPSSSNYNEEEETNKCEAMTKELAMSRARESNLDYETTLLQVKLEVGIELANILSRNLHPVFTTTSAVMIEEDGQVCAICLENMEKGKEARAMQNCRHKFHLHCIFEWVNTKANCPLCRGVMETQSHARSD